MKMQTELHSPLLLMDIEIFWHQNFGILLDLMNTPGFSRMGLHSTLQICQCKSPERCSLSGPDLTPLDFFSWGFLKSKVYSDAPRTLLQLKARIREDIQRTELALSWRVITNFRSPLEQAHGVKEGILMILFFIHNFFHSINWNKM